MGLDEGHLPQKLYGPVNMNRESLLSGAAGSFMDPPVARHDSNRSAGSSVDTVDMVPITGNDTPVALPGCSDPTGISTEKLLAVMSLFGIGYGP